MWITLSARPPRHPTRAHPTTAPRPGSPPPSCRPSGVVDEHDGHARLRDDALDSSHDGAALRGVVLVAPVELIGGVQDDQLGADSLRVRDQAADGCAVVQSEPFAVGDVQRLANALGSWSMKGARRSDRTPPGPSSSTIRTGLPSRRPSRPASRREGLAALRRACDEREPPADDGGSTRYSTDVPHSRGSPATEGSRLATRPPSILGDRQDAPLALGGELPHVAVLLVPEPRDGAADQSAGAPAPSRGRSSRSKRGLPRAGRPCPASRRTRRLPPPPKRPSR